MKAMRVLVLAAVVVALASPALANCNPGKNFGQLSADTNGYGYTYFTGASNAFSDMVGRFWTPGFRSTINEGTLDISQWLTFYGPDKGEFNAFLGDAQVNGCPASDMVVVLQAAAANGKGAYFAIGRVDEVSGPFNDFDYTRTSLNWNMEPIPAPPMNATRVGNTLTLNAHLSDASAAFHGLTGVQPTGTITALRLMRAVGATPPGPLATNWTYTGNSGAAGAAFGPFTFDCASASAEQDVWYAIQLQFVDSVLSDYVGVPTQVKCNSGLANPGGQPKHHKKH